MLELTDKFNIASLWEGLMKALRKLGGGGERKLWKENAEGRKKKPGMTGNSQSPI